jgi:ABC-2 type transport system ATP-binding protein
MSETGTSVAAGLEELSVRYGRTIALDRVSLSIESGTVYALLGRNGAGKSSLVRVLLGLQQADRGRATLFGEDAWRRRAALMARVAVVPEEPDAPQDMTGEEILRFCARISARWDGAQARARLDRFGVPLKTAFGRLSKGQRKQVSLAIALATSPELLVLDDPTLGLDVVAKASLFEELVSELADRGTTVLVTTHDLAQVEGVATRVGILLDGRIALDEEIDALKSRFRRLRFAKAAPGVEEALAPLRAIGTKRWGAGLEAVVGEFDEARVAAIAPSGVDVSPMSLEEIFLAVAGDREVSR